MEAKRPVKMFGRMSEYEVHDLYTDFFGAEPDEEE